MTGQGILTSAYIHFPWCLKKCPYCDFASAAVTRAEVRDEAYATAIGAELASRDVGGRRLESVFFGGGTPSLWSADALGRTLEAVREAFGATHELEVTVECNPTSIDADKTRELREVGVNRLSIGVQSLDDENLRFLGRLHDSAGALEALRGARSEMAHISSDLMFGMPGQGADDFAAEIEAILETGVEHVSAYALTIEKETLFGALHRKGCLQLAPDEDFADTFERAHEVFGAAGLEHYEVSNYARPGRTSRHNQHYWRGGDYLGLGAGAVGAMNGRRYRNDPRPSRYLEQPAGCEVFEETLSPEDRVREALMLGLRTAEGVRVDAVREQTGVEPSAGREAALERRVASGDLKIEGANWVVPHERWLHLDAIVTDLF